jgi:hypothetical protein
MKYAIEIGSGAMIYVHTKFHTNWFRHSKSNGGGGGIHGHRQEGNLTILLLFFFSK